MDKEKMKKKIKVEELLSNAANAIIIVAQTAAKTNAPKIFVKHLATAANEINEALEIWKYGNDNSGSN